MRQRIKFLQSKEVSDLTLSEVDELVDGLRNTESKLVYQKEILNKAMQQAVDENDMKLSQSKRLDWAVQSHYLREIGYFVSMYLHQEEVPEANLTNT